MSNQRSLRGKKRRIGAFSRRLSVSDLDLRTSAGKFAHAIKEGLEAQIGNPSPGQQILIKLVAIKVLRCEMMYEKVMAGGDLQDRIENYFLVWSNSIRRDLEALGVLDPVSGGNAEPFSLQPSEMTDEQLNAALALLDQQQPISAGLEERSVGIEAPA